MIAQNIKTTKLDNGITVISEFLPYVKSFSLGFWMDVGSRDEDINNNGISHFLEHMFFKGTEKRSAKRISDEIESLGGYLNAFTSKEHTCFYGRGLTEHFERIFRVLADMIQNSSFREKDILKESAVVVDELYDIEDSPEEIIFDKFESSIFSGNSLALPIIGTEKNLMKFKRDDLFKFISNKYSNRKFYIVASGLVDHDKLISLVEKYIKKSFSGNSKRRLFKLENTGNSQYNFFEKEIQQSHIIIGTSTFGFSDRRRAGLSLLSHILGEGSSSRLFYAVRERNGIGYQINSFLNSFFDTSAFGIYLSSNHNSILRADELINRELEKIRLKKVSEKELKKAKEYIKGSMLMSLENTTNRMVRLAQTMIYYGRVKTVEESIADIETVDENDILRLANSLLDPNSLQKVVISSKNPFS
ncbi:MAG: pitrilysin family protein [Melioribacteraceae bacterium]|nr:pitrilysin family protein [Melioribacteraceae bacterium]